MVFGGVHTAAAHYVSANSILVQVSELANNLAEFETPFWACETISCLKNLFMNVQGNTYGEFVSY